MADLNTRTSETINIARHLDNNNNDDKDTTHSQILQQINIFLVEFVAFARVISVGLIGNGALLSAKSILNETSERN